MTKPKMPRITEPDAGEVHYKGCDFIGNVTLCGLTDFIYDDEEGKDTSEAVTCESCKAVKRFCDSYRA